MTPPLRLGPLTPRCGIWRSHPSGAAEGSPFRQLDRFATCESRHLVRDAPDG
jgi:hypothetical protein